MGKRLRTQTWILVSWPATCSQKGRSRPADLRPAWSLSSILVEPISCKASTSGRIARMLSWTFAAAGADLARRVPDGVSRKFSTLNVAARRIWAAARAGIARGNNSSHTSMRLRTLEAQGTNGA